MTITDQTILITGGIGFIGSHAAEVFSDLGYNVVVVDNLSRPQINLKDNKDIPYNWSYLTQNYPLITKIKEDVRSAKILDLIQQFKPEIILHAAGQTSAVGSVEKPQNDFDNNVNGLFNVLESARRVGCVKDFLYLSTNKVYGDRVNTIPIKEDSIRYSPIYMNMQSIDESFSIDQSKHTPYGISKLAGDLYVQEFGHLYGMNTVVFRQSCIYGARQFGFVEQGWISHLLITALNNKPITIYGNGKQVRDLLYIDDLTRLFTSYIQWSNRPKSEVFNIGGGPEFSLSLLEAIQYIEQLIGRKIELKYEVVRPGDQKYFVSNIGKIKKTFGWFPKISPMEGIRRAYEWHQKNRELFL